MNSTRSDGFAHVVVILIALVLVGALGYVGFTALQKKNAKRPATYSSIQTMVDTQSKSESDLDASQQQGYSATSTDITSAASNLENSYAN